MLQREKSTEVQKKKKGQKEGESRKSSPDSGLGKGSGVKGQWSAPPILW